MEPFAHLTFKGHTGRITGLLFSQDDTLLFSCSTDGIVYQWSLIDGKRVELITKGPSLSHMAIKGDRSAIYLATHEDRSLIECTERFKKKYNMNTQISQVALTDNGRQLFASGAGLSQDNPTGLIFDKTKLNDAKSMRMSLKGQRSSTVHTKKSE